MNKALQAARDARAAIEAGTASKAGAHGQITVAEWVSVIWPAWDIELTTRANYSAPIRRFILPALGDRPLASLRREEIDRWERVLIDERGYSVEYIRGPRRRLHTILADAVTAGHLEVNPAGRQRGLGRKASQDRARATAERIWATEDAALLLAERCGLLGGEAEFIRVLLIAFTGLRWGEVNGLQASYVRGPDRRRNHFYIRVEWQMIELNGKFYLAPPKEGSRRDVDIPGWLFTLLQRIRAGARRCRCPRREEMLTRQTQRWQTAIAARARIDEARGAEPRSALPALDEWLAPFPERDRESSSHLHSHRQDPEVEA
jgi:integrase